MSTRRTPSEMLRPKIDLPPREVERFFVLDFDRCIGNTTKLHTLLEAIVASETNITSQQMRHAREAMEQSGGSFDTAQYVRDTLRAAGKSDDWTRLADRFITEGRQQDMLEPGARELLGVLDSADATYGIVTYGGELWQTAKLLAAGLEDTPYIVTDIKKKGQLLSTWQREDEFAVPQELYPYQPLTARHLTLIDDKATSFSGLPDGADGIIVLPTDGSALLPSQRGSTPASVVHCHGLHEVTELISDMLVA